jgi:hypothetical protein
MLLTCFSTVFSLTKRPRAMALLERPSAMSARTSRSRSVKRSSGSLEDRGRPISWLTTSVQEPTTQADPAYAGRELGQVRQAIL